MKRFGILTIVFFVWAGGCDNPAADKPAAEVGEPATPTPKEAEAEPEAQPETEARRSLSFTAADSSIQMVGSKVTGSHDIEVKDFEGDVELPAKGPPESGSVRVVMQMASVEADHPKLTKHLKTDDFFLVEKHPEATFESTSIEKGGTEGATYTVTGDLTLRGVTKQIRFPATIDKEGDAVKVKAEFSIDRQDFGISYPGMPDDLIRDEVLIKLDLRAS